MNLCSGMVDLETEFYQIPNVLMYLFLEQESSVMSKKIHSGIPVPSHASQ